MISGFTAFSTVFQNFSTDCRFVCMSKVGWCGLDGGVGVEGGGGGGWKAMDDTMLTAN